MRWGLEYRLLHFPKAHSLSAKSGAGEVTPDKEGSRPRTEMRQL